MSESSSGETRVEKPDAKKLTELHPVWWALGLVFLGAIGMWHLFTSLEERVTKIARDEAKFPAGAIVAFSQGPGRCPPKWREVTELQGKVLVGAGQGTDLQNRPYGQPGGSETVTLRAENIPPHRHQVYRHAGEIVGNSLSGIKGAGSADLNTDAYVREGLSGPGVGMSGELLVAAPVKVMPPYVAYTFCRPDEV